MLSHLCSLGEILPLLVSFSPSGVFYPNPKNVRNMIIMCSLGEILPLLVSFSPPGEFYPNPKNVRNMIIIANTDIFIGQKFTPLNLYPTKMTLLQKCLRSTDLCKFLLNFPIRFELQNFTPMGAIFEFYIKYIIRCFLLKYWPIFLLGLSVLDSFKGWSNTFKI